MTPRAAVSGSLAAIVAACALGIAAVPAGAESAYRYWAYWTASSVEGDATWQYATEGSGTRVPRDGDVEGWRFGLGGESEPLAPSVEPDFDAICASTPQPADGKRVAVVIDPGLPEHAPPGETPGPLATECVAAESGATGFQVLAELTTIRTDAGFVCGLGGYPKAECAPFLDADAEPSAQTAADIESESDAAAGSAVAAQAPEGNTTQDEPSSAATPLVTAAAISVLALVSFGLWRASRRRQAA